MRNKFTIEEVREFWNSVAHEYDDINKKIGGAHYQRFVESLKYLDLQTQDKILNIWSRTGNAINYLRQTENLEIHNLEVSEKMLALAKKKYPQENFQITDLENLPFADNFFDKILSLETLEHAPKPEKLLSEFCRVLKPGGLLIMSLPPKTAEIPLRIYEFFFDNHGEGPHNFLSSKTVKKILSDVGFKNLLHKGTLLFPAGPKWLQNVAEKIIEKFQSTIIKELGIRQFYVSKKPAINMQEIVKVNNEYNTKHIKNKIALTFDLEYWYCGKFLKKYLSNDLSEEKEYYPEMTEKILELLKNNGSQATFFVLGKIIKENPDLIKKIIEAGHEIAYHGWHHIPLDELTKEEFNDNLNESQKLIIDIINQSFLGFRAPNFSLKKENIEFWQILRDNNFIYDSSLIGEKNKEINNLKEIPVSSQKFFNFDVPLGGWYFRILPYWLFKLILKIKIKKGCLPIIYLHMMDLWPQTPNIKLPYFIKKIKYWGINKSWYKLKKFLEDFQSIRLDGLLE